MAAVLPSHIHDHLHTIFLSTVGFAVVHHLAAPELVRFVLGKKAWDALSSRDRVGWQSRLTSLTHALLILPLTARCLHIPALAADRAFGWDPRAGTLLGVASGYFLWDSIVSLVHFEGVGFVVHGLACLIIYVNAFRPFLAYYGARFLLWELSTPFLNVHWYRDRMLDKTGKTGTLLQLVNGLTLIGTFAGARLVYGSIMSLQFYQTLFEVRDGVSVVILLGYAIGNTVLNGLNVVWFTKMIAALRKRFSSPAPNPKDTKARTGTTAPTNGAARPKGTKRD
ncbi:DUF887-domain-containing protein [Gloeopeniophorella convolvens]|nr:DUF887-domain-containing protein [Gloeopeniophorella convolvens]